MEYENPMNVQSIQKCPSTHSTQSFTLYTSSLNHQGCSKILAKFSQFTDKSGKSRLLLPVVTQSKSAMAYGFSVRFEQEGGEPSPKNIQSVFQKNLKPQIQGQGSILVPKPKNSVCYVCKRKFIDYLKHVDSETHKEHIRACQIRQQIRQIAQKQFSNRRRPSVSDYLQEDIGVGHKPTKRRAIDQTPSLVQIRSLKI